MLSFQNIIIINNSCYTSHVIRPAITCFNHLELKTRTITSKSVNDNKQNIPLKYYKHVLIL